MFFVYCMYARVFRAHLHTSFARFYVHKNARALTRHLAKRKIIRVKRCCLLCCLDSFVVTSDDACTLERKTRGRAIGSGAACHVPSINLCPAVYPSSVFNFLFLTCPFPRRRRVSPAPSCLYMYVCRRFVARQTPEKRTSARRTLGRTRLV